MNRALGEFGIRRSETCEAVITCEACHEMPETCEVGYDHNGSGRANVDRYLVETTRARRSCGTLTAMAGNYSHVHWQKTI